MDKNTKRNIVIGVVGAVVIIGTGVFFYNQYKKNNPPPSTPQANPNANNPNQASGSGAGTGAGNCGAGCVSYWKMFFDPSYAFGVMKNIK